MNKNNFYISFAVWLIIIPLLGVPIVWRDGLVFLSGLFLLLVSFGPAILKKLQPKAKNKKKQGKVSLDGLNENSNELGFSVSEENQIRENNEN